MVVFFLAHLFLWSVFTEKYNEYAYFFLNLLYFFVSSVLILAFYASYKLLKVDKIKAIIFFTAFSALFISICLFILVQYGWINESFFIINPILIGSGIEILILSVAMMYILKKMILSKKALELKTEELNKIQLQLNEDKQILQQKLNVNAKITISLKSKAVIILDKIQFIKSDGHYLEYHLDGKKNPEIDRNTMKKALEVLPSNLFVQIHKSYIVNIQHIRIINSSQLMLNNGSWLPLSRTYKPSLKNILHKK